MRIAATGLILWIVTLNAIGKSEVPHRIADAEIVSLLKTHDFEVMAQIIKMWKATPLSRRIDLLSALLPHVSSGSETPINNATDMVVRSRLRPTKREFPGHNLILLQDVYVEGGRAAWAIEELVGTAITPIVANSTLEDRRSVQNVARMVVESYNRGVADAMNEKSQQVNSRKTDGPNSEDGNRDKEGNRDRSK
jgi:hypothetical protein